MLKVAIVGNIASGKSTVENFLASNGFVVFDTDKIAHEILNSSDEVRSVFGTVDRKELAKIVFAEPEKLKLLESIIQPKVKSELDKIFKENYKIVFVSVPQLFEAGFEELFDKIIYITANEQIRLQRLIKRNGYSESEAKIRICAQSEENKREKSDFVIENNGSLIELEKKIKEILSILVR